MKKILFALILCCATPIVTSGCSIVQDLMAPRADGSSMTAFKESIQKMREALSPEDRDKLDKAVAYQSAKFLKENKGAVIAGGLAALLDDKGTDNAALQGVEKDFLKQFDGKTAKQIIRDYENADK